MCRLDRGDFPELTPELERVHRELAAAFRVERALFAADMRARVLARLPRAVGPAVRVARMLAAAVVLGSLGLLALVFELVNARAGAWSAEAGLQVSLGVGAALAAVLLAFACPRLGDWERGLLGRPVLPERERQRRALVARVAAVALLAVTAMVLAVRG